MKKLLILITLFTIHLVFSGYVQIDEKDTPSIIKSSYLYNFAKMVDWSESKKKGNFVFCVLGDPGLTLQLSKKYSSKSIGSQPVEITSPAEIDVNGNYNIVFISKKIKTQTKEIIQKLKDQKVLIVTEQEGGLELGAAVNLKIINSTIKFEINEENALKHDVTIGVTLSSLAK